MTNNLANADTNGFKKEGATSQAFDTVLAYKIKDLSEPGNLPRNLSTARTYYEELTDAPARTKSPSCVTRYPCVFMVKLPSRVYFTEDTSALFVYSTRKKPGRRLGQGGRAGSCGAYSAAAGRSGAAGAGSGSR